jgi:hypothetical protein
MVQDAKDFVKQINECKGYLLKTADMMRKQGGDISKHPEIASLPPIVVAEMKKYNQGERTFEEMFARIATQLP